MRYPLYARIMHSTPVEMFRRFLLCLATLRIYPMAQGSVWSYHPVRIRVFALAHDLLQDCMPEGSWK